MADGPALALQDALVAHLRADSGVSAIVAQRVYDEPPQHVRFPYIRLGPINDAADRIGCYTDDTIVFSIECHSSPPAGRVEATRMGHAVRVALDDVDLTLAGYTLDWCFFLTSAVSRAAEQHRYVCTVAFEAAVAEIMAAP